MSVQAPTLTLMRNGWGQAVASLRHGRGWGTTLLAFAAMLLLLQCTLLFAFGVGGVNRLLLQRAALRLEVSASAPDQSIQELYAELQALSSVESVTYVPREKAYEQQRLADPELVSFLEQYDLENPFPDSFVVTLRGQAYDALLAVVQQERYRAVIDPASLSAVSRQEQDLQGVLRLTSLLHVASYALAVLAAVVLCAMMLQYATRSLRARSDEFLLQQSLGAAPSSLAALLASELTLLFVMAFAVSLLAAGAVAASVPFLVPLAGGGDAFLQLQGALLPLLTGALPLALLAQILLFPACAWIVASLAVRRTSLRPS